MPATNPKLETTYVMVKPDGVRRGLVGEIIRRIEASSLKIVALKLEQPNFEQMDNHYPKEEAWITRLGEKTLKTYAKAGWDPKEELGTDKPEDIGPLVRKWLIEFMTSGPVVKMAVQGVQAVDTIRKLTGPTMPIDAAPGTIRGDFSNDTPLIANFEKRPVTNIIHASETPEEAAHEIKHWFGEEGFVEYVRTDDLFAE